jgi:hypothetical protein
MLDVKLEKAPELDRMNQEKVYPIVNTHECKGAGG